MASYPTSLDTLTNPVATDTLDTPDHATQHSDANDILEALEAKVGIGADTAASGEVLVGTGAGSSEWGQYSHASRHLPSGADALTSAAPGSSAVGDSAAAGSAESFSRSDHRHGREAFATPAIVLGTAAAAGSAATPIRSDSTIIAFDATAPTTQAVGDSAATGSAAVAARRDHKHGIPAFGSPAAVSTANSDGVATTIARSDHGHKGDWDGIITKAVTESVASSTVTQNDDELFVALTSGKVYLIELLIAYDSTAGGATPDIKYDIGEDATDRGAFSAWRFNITDAGGTVAVSADQAAFTSGTATTARLMLIRGVYFSNGGTFRFRWAQNTSGVNATRVLAGSILRYKQIN